MGIFKEELCILEDLERRQTRLWPHNIDSWGVLATDEVKENMRRVLEVLLPLEDSKVTFKLDTADVRSRGYELTIRFGRDEYVTYNVSYHKNAYKEYFNLKHKYVFSRERS